MSKASLQATHLVQNGPDGDRSRVAGEKNLRRQIVRMKRVRRHHSSYAEHSISPPSTSLCPPPCLSCRPQPARRCMGSASGPFPGVSFCSPCCLKLRVQAVRNITENCTVTAHLRYIHNTSTSSSSTSPFCRRGQGYSLILA